MSGIRTTAAVATLAGLSFAWAGAQQPNIQLPVLPPTVQPDDVVRTLVGKLELERYKATIKGLTQFGDRREGTERNRRAVDWIEMQLESYGCETARVTYDPLQPVPPAPGAAEGRGGGRGGGGGGRGRGAATPPRTPAGTP
jgi:hypothetical protein